MSSPLRLAEELLHRIVLFLVDEDYDYKPFPNSMYHYISSDIVSLSLVSQQFRRICFPFLFSYVKCETVEEVEKLEKECLSKAAFTGCIRILQADFTPCDASRAVLVRLLPRLKSLVWLELGETEVDEAILIAINSHATLKTVMMAPEHLGFLPKLPVSLDKFMVHHVEDFGELSIAEERDMRVMSSWLSSDTLSCWKAIFLPDLREICFGDYEFLEEPDEDAVDQFYEFVDRHHSLTRIGFHTEDFATSLWREPEQQNDIVQPFISTFIQAAESQSLNRTSVVMREITLSSIGTRWEVTGLELTVSSVETLSLAGITFPRLSSLTLSLSSLMHLETFIRSILANFPNLRVLCFDRTCRLLNCTPLLIPSYKESLKGYEDALAWTRFLAWRILQAVPTLVQIYASSLGSFDGSHVWFSGAEYKPWRNSSGTMINMKLAHSVKKSHMAPGGQQCNILKLRESVVL
ncbi:hypothetical protein C8J56DRAFT_916206 [Mycena floridula]|nr:hypothetical protein C8J56DRAFT_916206 [Mycena floridula]